MKSQPDVIALAGLVTKVEGEVFSIQARERLAADHPVVVALPDRFAPVGTHPDELERMRQANSASRRRARAPGRASIRQRILEQKTESARERAEEVERLIQRTERGLSSYRRKLDDERMPRRQLETSIAILEHRLAGLRAEQASAS